MAVKRRRERTAKPPLDARGVFYGKPLLEFVAREMFAACTRPETNAGTIGDTIREIHAAWLLTPRDDLDGLCPRDVALERRDHLTWDLQDQSENWSLLDRCPPGLDESTFAFRYGGFGTHELVKYYELVRELVWSCWGRLEEQRKSQPAAFTVEDFLTGEVPRLECVREAWLDSPNPECHGRTPRSIIDRERTRLPERMSPHEAMVDPDCPCCQMLADMPGPAFWHLDGCNMDDDFAFDIRHSTREEWEAEQREWEERSRQFNAEWEERKRLGVTESDFGGPAEKSVWSSNFSVGENAEVPLGVRLFGIGAHLAELVVDLHGDADRISGVPEAQRFIDRLNRGFGNLREVLQSSEVSLAAALIQPVMDCFAETLADVAAADPRLSKKCESLRSMVSRFLEPHTPQFNTDDEESNFPF